MTEANDQERVEAACRALYNEVGRLWQGKKLTYPTWELGYSILYSPPRYRPELLMIGENPGSDVGQQYSDSEHAGWPDYNSYHRDTYRLALKLQSLFGQIQAMDILQDSVGFNMNFFRSRPSGAKDVGFRWKDNPSPIQIELEEFCRTKVLQLIELMQPKLIVTLGFKAFASIVAGPGVTLEHRPSSCLCLCDHIRSIPVLGIIHPTGSHVSGSDWSRIMKRIQNRLRRG